MTKKTTTADTLGEAKSVTLDLQDSTLALQVFGPNEGHLKTLEELVPVVLKSRGTEITIQGNEQQIQWAKRVLQHLRDQAVKGMNIQNNDVLDCVKALRKDQDVDLNQLLKDKPVLSGKKTIYPRTAGQKQYVQGILSHDISFGIGPAGTGKTYLAMAVGVAKLLSGEFDRIILTRPAVEAGEKLGFLPGDLAEKVNPYLRPLLDALHEMIDYERAQKMLVSGQIEIAPIAFMRGRTLSNSYVILDEAQNCTREQMKMFLTRLGEKSKAVITGDVTQIDLPREVKCGLIQAAKILSNIPGIFMHHFTDVDVVRHPLVAKIIKAYDKDGRLP